MNKPVIGLTGPTGAGKSTVASLFRENGCAVVDADVLAREAVEDRDCLAKLKEAFGQDIAGEDGRLNRRLLAERAFSTRANAELLNAVTHPVIMDAASKRIAQARESGAKAVVLDAALLFESGADRLCDATVAVTAPDDSRLKRIMKRDGITEEQALERMKNQHGASYYKERADYFIDGTTPWSELPPKAGKLLQTILRELHAEE